MKFCFYSNARADWSGVQLDRVIEAAGVRKRARKTSNEVVRVSAIRTTAEQQISLRTPRKFAKPAKNIGFDDHEFQQNNTTPDGQ